MILVVDCGSTKSEWAVLDDVNVVSKFAGDGFNPNFCDDNFISEIIEKSLKNIDNQYVEKLYFYGSGCGNEANQRKVAAVFKKFLNKTEIVVYPDTLGSCHALFGSNPGIACILGTGSNACLYDGEKITQNAVSLGFMIGDAGSGSHIGKKIVHDYFFKIMPEDLRQKFDEKYHLDREKFLKRLYQGEQSSRYLADFSRFASENLKNNYIFEKIGTIFDEFITDMLCPLNPQGKKVGFVGSVAYCFQDILRQRLENQHITCEKIIKNPIDGLVDYYKNL